MKSRKIIKLQKKLNIIYKTEERKLKTFIIAGIFLNKLIKD